MTRRKTWKSFCKQEMNPLLSRGWKTFANENVRVCPKYSVQGVHFLRAGGFMRFSSRAIFLLLPFEECSSCSEEPCHNPSYILLVAINVLKHQILYNWVVEWGDRGLFLIAPLSNLILSDTGRCLLSWDESRSWIPTERSPSHHRFTSKFLFIIFRVNRSNVCRRGRNPQKLAVLQRGNSE